MASPLFCHGLLDDLRLQFGLGVHLLEAAILFLKLLHALHERGVHAAELGTSFVERGVAHAMLPAKLRNGRTCLGLLEDGDDLAVGVA